MSDDLSKKVDDVQKSVNDLTGIVRDMAVNMDERFQEIQSSMDVMKSDIIQNMDSIAKNSSEQELESKAQISINQRHESWINQIADETGIELAA